MIFFRAATGRNPQASGLRDTQPAMIDGDSRDPSRLSFSERRISVAG
jgi:hypothetical protein